MPRPTAKAREAQEPEPEPQNAADGEAVGSKPTGQAPPGKETQQPAAADTAATTAADRAAKPPRPRDRSAWNTRQDNRERNTRSVPSAHPTKTAPKRHSPANELDNSCANHSATANDWPDNEREPEIPTAGKVAINPKTSAATEMEDMMQD